VLIARFLEGRGLRVGMVAQPRWDDASTTSARMGRPRLFVGISAGNLDSMLNKLTAQKKVRSEDQYSPDGAPDRRPEPRLDRLLEPRAAGVPRAAHRARRHRGVLRRIAHYDYWSDQVRRSVLLDARPTCWCSAWASAPSGRSRRG
jgi:radical SAM superfamily enzyme YgiQ (UPF0313 family)